jgi:hypothetical protein
MKQLFCLLVCSISALWSMAQRDVRDSVLTSPQILFSAVGQLPFADMNDRFGVNAGLGVAFNIKTNHNWFYGVEGTFIFGKEVTEPGLLSNLLTDRGEIISQNGQPAKLNIEERGWMVSLHCGKLFPIIGPNPNSGILIKGGIGFIQHKIRLEHQIHEITQLEGDYLKGYDRLTNGLLLSQFVGYNHMSNNRIANFIVGVDIYEGLTKNRRDLNYDTMEREDNLRLDGLAGLRIGWIIHMYPRTSNQFFYD